MRSTAEEDYLKAMLGLEEAGIRMTTSMLAERLGVRPASVTGMIQRLSERELVVYEPYRGARLTDRGRAAALATLRRHRLIELFLVQILGLPWEMVHQEAERWEHVVSDEALERMDVVLGRPTRDPHGSPIPSADGSLARLAGRPLSEFAPGDQARVLELKDNDPRLLQYLGDLGILPDVELEIIAVEPFDGPVTVRIGTRRAMVGRAALSQVLAASPAGAEEREE